jgi:hypothetical protein
MTIVSEPVPVIGEVVHGGRIQGMLRQGTADNMVRYMILVNQSTPGNLKFTTYRMAFCPVRHEGQKGYTSLVSNPMSFTGMLSAVEALDNLVSRTCLYGLMYS